ncbi:hypothetical protein [Glaciecola sp. SC05]
MTAQTETQDSFNWWYLLGIVGSLVVLALMPYVAWIGKLILL